ncbi:MAG: sigma-70 family RNA polymerase sigma factor [Calditrichaeota bacterium]|nr:MAG: RNA polymerase subunit sigma-70 [Calditrichota bacterium]MBL1206029.1 sigma-70 family RNA polymerase sigma factor [Calditrichota bacterium]NOG45857.1 sigma-70 family RNA polymerase sigma factor [Calditrichota bacterium]
MTDSTPQNVTIMLNHLSDGQNDVVDQLLPIVYEDLQKIAHNQLRRERSNHTINTQALVHEAYLKLVDQRNTDWKNRAHFFAICAQAMRRILINYAKSRLTEKRGAGEAVATFNEEAFVRETKAEELIILDEALTRLAKMNERQSKVVELRFFAGLTQEEIAEVLGVSKPTVRLDWRFARAWLSRELEKNS